MNHIRRLSGLAGALLLSAAAHAQGSNVQLFGVVDVYAGKKQLATTNGAKTTSIDSGGMTTSQWGLRGSEDLGGGLAAIFEISGFLRADSGDAGRFSGDMFFARSSFVGLQGPWGALRLGRVSTPNFIATIRLNPFADSTTFGPVLLHTYVGGQPMDAAIAAGGPAGISDSAHNNTLAYSTPTVGGFSGAISYSAGEVAGQGGANRRIGYSVTWAKGPTVVALSGEQVHAPTLPPPPVVPAANQKRDQSTLQFGASHDFGPLRGFAQVSRTDVDLPAANREFRTVQTGVSAPIGAGKLLISVARTTRQETALSEVRRTTWAIGYDHELSRRTDVYLVAMRDTVTGMQSGTTLAVGVRHRF